MNYRNKKIAITGASGFIGTALVKRLVKAGADVTPLIGDVRDPETYKPLDHTFDYLFHFAAPSSQVLFKRKPAYCIDTTIKGFMLAANAARSHGVRFIYPSTGLLSQDKFNEYAMCKKICEDYVAGLGIDALGIRIFATYGPGEGHKADYASVPYLFARDIVNGTSPVVYGDGGQFRDFIYIDDVVEGIMQMAEGCDKAIIDLGSNKPYSFNHLINTINFVVGPGLGVLPTFVKKPGGYVNETLADQESFKYHPKSKRIDIEEGIARLVKSLEDIRDGKAD